MSDYYPIVLKCPYCKNWFRVKNDLNGCISNINRHIGVIHPDRDRIRIEFVTTSLLAYVRVSKKPKSVNRRKSFSDI